MSHVTSTGTSSGTQALQSLQALQAFRTRPVDVHRPETSETSAPSMPFGPVDEAILSGNPDVLQRGREKTKHNGLSNNNPMIKEVHDMARQLGYVGLSDQAIQRAYLHGESLLADVRV